MQYMARAKAIRDRGNELRKEREALVLQLLQKDAEIAEWKISKTLTEFEARKNGFDIQVRLSKPDIRIDIDTQR